MYKTNNTSQNRLATDSIKVTCSSETHLVRLPNPYFSNLKQESCSVEVDSVTACTRTS